MDSSIPVHSVGSQCKIIWGSKPVGDQSKVKILFSTLKEAVETSWLISVQCSSTCAMLVVFTGVVDVFTVLAMQCSFCMNLES